MQRNTLQNSLILEMVNKLKCHATAEEIYAAISVQYPNISKTTVYRNLNKLARDGKIYKIEVPGQADHYDHMRDEHYHIRCLNCAKIFDIDIEFVNNLQSSIKDAHGFVVNGCDLVFKGICPKCKNIIRGE